MAGRVAGTVIGVVFGLALCSSGISDPDVIRSALLFEDSYLFLFMTASMGTAAIGLQVLRRVRQRAVIGGAPLTWATDRPQRRHVRGSIIFGVGWGIAGACPGPIATQVGQGMPWGMVIATGTVAGVALYLRRGAAETEPAAAPAPEPAAAPELRPQPA